ncbi:PTS-dependent dihydroxyacetone kinase phosphotransferase subunit DhaM [Streptomyces sp. NBC_01294]|uniref:PTS-dependent dihydroxyacetone kinase phosphotransferase subunit DhaM n=1 Tax=Streptomyces sp. NBC_01294 TaxID=2903815 RepID=UPI002DD94167|nr:PTS fructose transporter subunit IIA [Streptomyces sp. NBC_01294]WRZ60980.1 PTS fructose transporter subunit IIA [Streptomyces sp. NBC_01294]
MTDGGGLVGIVLVSHSAAVAESVAELARGLAAGGPVAPVAAAGGTAVGGLGTSAERIVAAAREVDQGAGIALLADLGSSVLTVKSLLLEDELPAGSRLVDAPFLEGAVAAVVSASAGAPLATVESTAADAYTYRKS